MENKENDNIIDNDFKEMLTSETISIAGGILAGIILATYIDKLFLIPGMLILIPGLLELRGSISGSYAARLTSGMFLKVIDPKKPNKKIMKGNIAATFFLATLSALILGIMATIATYIFTGQTHLEIILIAIAASVTANFIEIPIVTAITLYIFKKGHDPNNIMGPFVTTIGDINSIICLLIIVTLI